MLTFETKAWNSGKTCVAGIDEAGRGPLAGSVVSTALVFDPEYIKEAIHKELKGLTDSKKLSEKKRDHFYEILSNTGCVRYSTAESSAKEVDDINILKATHREMKRAAEGLKQKADLLLVDGLKVPNLPGPALFIVQGDSKSISIAAASVIAKVTRDKQMCALAKKYPVYGFERHKGYGTKEHLEALRKFGPCPAHRFSFKRVSNQELF